MTEAAKDEMSGSGQLLILTTSGRKVAFEITSIVELIRMVALTPIPEAPAWIAGALNLRGTLLPVVDLARRFELDPVAPGLDTPIAIGIQGGRRVGLLADRALGVVTVAAEDLSPPDELLGHAGPVRAIARYGSEIVPILDLGVVGAGTEVLVLPEIDEHAA